MIEVDNKDLKQYVKNLKEVHKNAYPKAVRSTLDRMAFLTKSEYKENVKKEFVIRNGKSNIVVQSIGYEKCGKSIKINEMTARVGQFALTHGKKTEQLKKQEFGESILAKNKYIPKPTKTARGGSYRRIVPKDNLLTSLKVKTIEDLTNHPAKNHMQQFKQAIGIVHRTLKEGEFINFLPHSDAEGKKFGIARLYNKGSYKDEKGKRHTNGKSIKFMYTYKKDRQLLIKRPVLESTAKEVMINAPKEFIREAERRIKKEMSKGLKK